MGFVKKFLCFFLIVFFLVGGVFGRDDFKVGDENYVIFSNDFLLKKVNGNFYDDEGYLRTPTKKYLNNGGKVVENKNQAERVLKNGFDYEKLFVEMKNQDGINRDVYGGIVNIAKNNVDLQTAIGNSGNFDLISVYLSNCDSSNCNEEVLERVSGAVFQDLALEGKSYRTFKSDFDKKIAELQNSKKGEIENKRYTQENYLDDYNQKRKELLKNAFSNNQFGVKIKNFNGDGVSFTFNGEDIVFKNGQFCQNKKCNFDLKDLVCGDDYVCDAKASSVEGFFNSYDDLEVVVSSKVGSAVLDFFNLDSNAIDVAKYFFGYEPDYSDLSRDLRESFTTNLLCSDEYQAYMNAKSSNILNSQTKYGDCGPNGGVCVKSDIRGEMTPVTPDGKTYISYSVYQRLDKKEDVYYFIGVLYRDYENQLRKKFLVEPVFKKDASEIKISDTVLFPLNESLNVTESYAESYKIIFFVFSKEKLSKYLNHQIADRKQTLAVNPPIYTKVYLIRDTTSYVDPIFSTGDLSQEPPTMKYGFADETLSNGNYDNDVIDINTFFDMFLNDVED